MTIKFYIVSLQSHGNLQKSIRCLQLIYLQGISIYIFHIDKKNMF